MSSNAVAEITKAAPRQHKIRSYDHTDFYPTIRPSDVFLCTYPKSGTTWLGFLLAQILKSDPAEQLDLKSFNKYVPDVNLLYTKRGSLAEYSAMPDPRFFLCHATCDLNLPRVVYVLRDPRDVMVSYWHYQRFLHADFHQSLAEYIQSEDHWPCEWDDHVASWLLPRKHPNLLVVKYEEIHADPTAVLEKVLDFSGVKADPHRVAVAIESSRFEHMRAAEQKFGVHGKAGDPNEHFVRKGRVGSWREEMNFTDIRVFEKKYGRIMKKVGYEPAS